MRCPNCNSEVHKYDHDDSFILACPLCGEVPNNLSINEMSSRKQRGIKTNFKRHHHSKIPGIASVDIKLKDGITNNNERIIAASIDQLITQQNISYKRNAELYHHKIFRNSLDDISINSSSADPHKDLIIEFYWGYSLVNLQLSTSISKKISNIVQKERHFNSSEKMRFKILLDQYKNEELKQNELIMELRDFVRRAYILKGGQI